MNQGDRRRPVQHFTQLKDRSIAGLGSEVIAPLTEAWARLTDFRQALSSIGTEVNLTVRVRVRGRYQILTAIQYKPLRIFLQDGSNDNRRKV